MENNSSVIEYKALAVLHNSFINGHYQMSRYELRIFTAMLEMLDKDDTKFQTFLIPVSEIFSSTNYRSGQVYEEIKKACEKLSAQVVRIERQENESSVRVKNRQNLRRKLFNTDNPERKFSILPLMAMAQYQEGNGYIEVEFNEKVKPFLLQLKENFTKTQIVELLKLKNIYSFRLYWLLKQYENFGRRIFLIEDFRALLSLEEKYKKFAELVRWVIEPALEEINTTDIIISYQEHRKSNRLESIEFSIQSRYPKQIEQSKPRLQAISNSTAETSKEGTQKVPLDIVLRQLELSEMQIETILSAFKPEQIYQIAYRINLHCNDNKGINKAAYAYTQFQNALRFN